MVYSLLRAYLIFREILASPSVYCEAFATKTLSPMMFKNVYYWSMSTCGSSNLKGERTQTSVALPLDA